MLTSRPTAALRIKKIAKAETRRPWVCAAQWFTETKIVHLLCSSQSSPWSILRIENPRCASISRGLNQFSSLEIWEYGSNLLYLMEYGSNLLKNPPKFPWFPPRTYRPSQAAQCTAWRHAMGLSHQIQIIISPMAPGRLGKSLASPASLGCRSP